MTRLVRCRIAIWRRLTAAPGAAGRRRTATVIASAACVAAIAWGAVYYVKAVRALDRTSSANSRLSFADREVAGGNSIVVDQEAVYEAREVIPEHDSYRVVTGDRLKNATSLTLPFIGTWMTYFLMPRRPDPGARWVICYGCDPAALGAPFAADWQDDDGIVVGHTR